jgi:Flp pilus assembly protein TadD
VVIGVPPAYRGYNLFQNKSLNLGFMLGAERSLSQTQFESIYSHGWALTHYLTFAPNRRGQLDRYIASIQHGVPALRAAEQAFGDLGKLSQEVNSYGRREKLPQLVLTGMREPDTTITVRPLSDAESAIMRVHMRSERGANKRTAGDIAGDARKVAADYPSDAFVQAALAQAEFDAKNFAAADAAADRALAGDPKQFSALITKGKAQMELARAAGHGNWAEIRKWILKANKLDSEAAEPLMLFYKTYAYEGVSPTKNAVDGLLYAAALAPQDNKLRLLAVNQLVADARFDEAKRTFAPFVLSPHSKGKWQDASNKAAAAIAQRQRDEALNHIAKVQELLEEE